MLGRFNMHLSVASGWWPKFDGYTGPASVLGGPVPTTHGALVDAMAARLLVPPPSAAVRTAVCAFFDTTPTTADQPVEPDGHLADRPPRGAAARPPVPHHPMRPAMTTPTLPASCGCSPEAGLSRRAVLRAMAAGGALGAAVAVAGEGTHSRYAFAADGATGDTIVILSLRGGFDGISAVAPVGDPYYLTAGPGMAVAAGTAIPLDRTFALHPKMAPLKKWWDSGHLAVVTDVGQAAPDPLALRRDGRDGARRTGFRPAHRLDRPARRRPRHHRRPRRRADRVEQRAVVVHRAGDRERGPFDRLVLDDRRHHRQGRHRLDARPSPRCTPADRPACPARCRRCSARSGRSRRCGPGPGRRTPSTRATATGTSPRWRGALADTARLIKAGVGLSVATIDSGDWDIHEGAGVNTTWGRTPRKLEELAAAMSAFAADLGTHLADVSLVTLSEFGRRVSQNGTDGTDHGHGNMVFALGGGINGGRVHGSWTGLAPGQLRRRRPARPHRLPRRASRTC